MHVVYNNSQRSSLNVFCDGVESCANLNISNADNSFGHVSIQYATISNISGIKCLLFKSYEAIHVHVGYFQTLVGIYLDFVIMYCMVLQLKIL